jgi:hypothetical protein
VSDAIGHRIEHLAKIGDLVAPPSEKAIEEIGAFANDEKTEEDVGHESERNAEMSSFQIDNRKQGTDKDPEEGKKVGNVHRF